MNYGKRWWRQAGPCLAVFAAFHLYFFFFIPGGRTVYLFYLDVLLLMPGLWWTGADYIRFRKKEDERKELLGQNNIICRMKFCFDNQDIAEHDVQVVEEQLNRQFEDSCDLQDYVAKWCHELKIPLAAGLLINEKNPDPGAKMSMREQLERINQLLGSMLLGCRLQSPLFDLQIKKVRLADCVKTSIHNNQFFLIQKRFRLELRADNLEVYTDSAWLVYILDQFIGNALKYGQRYGEEAQAPCLSIWTQKEQDSVTLWVEDCGEGIKDRDIRRIFEKGYTGSNYHNGKYKSTGMGLYMVSKIADRLGHKIRVESEYGKGSRFGVVLSCRSCIHD